MWEFATTNPGTTLLIVIVIAMAVESIGTHWADAVKAKYQAKEEAE